MNNNDFNLWTPPSSEGSDNAFKDSNDYLKWSLANISSMPRENVEAVVKNLVKIGFVYHAGRCLEISSQYKIGVFFTGQELINYRYPNFGEFHQNIKTLIQAGSLYNKCNRKTTAYITFQRALNFVEEALRQIESYEEGNTKEVLCLAIAFELAGHCAILTSNSDGIDYYNAAKEYWEKSIALDQEEFENWKTNKITQIVIECLKESLDIIPVDFTDKEKLLSDDFEKRINISKELFF